MRVVELEAVLVGETREVVAVVVIPVPQRVLQARRNQEVLLLEPQLATALGRVVRVEHHRDVLGFVLRGHGILVAARVEFLEVELVSRGRRPEPQGIHDLVTKTRYRHIVGNREHILGAFPAVAGIARQVLVGCRVAAELDGLCKFETFDLPGESFAQPRIGFLDLVAVVDTLMEHAVVVADAVADDGQRERRAAIEEAGGEPAEAAVAEARVPFAVEHGLQVEAESPERLARLVLDADAVQRIVQETPHEELERDIAGPPDVVAFHREPGPGPALHQPVPGRVDHGLVEKRRLGADRPPAEHAAEVMREILEDRVGRHGQARRLQQFNFADTR